MLREAGRNLRGEYAGVRILEIIINHELTRISRNGFIMTKQMIHPNPPLRKEGIYGFQNKASGMTA